jgi:hypothetical protein
MVVGKAISNQDRKHICHIHITLRYSPERIHDILFRGTEISLEYMQKLYRKLHDRDFRHHYLLGPHRHSGRPRILSFGERQLVAQMAMDMKSFRVAKLREDFAALYYGNIQHCSSQSTILRTLRRAGLSRKTMERRHIQRNDVEGVLFLDTIAHRNPLFCVDIDGMACSRTDFFFKFGWAPVGERCVFQQSHLLDFYVGKFTTAPQHLNSLFISWRIECNRFSRLTIFWFWITHEFTRLMRLELHWRQFSMVTIILVRGTHLT